MITYAMGGRAAEMLVFGRLTTGAGNDIERATSLARKMVCEWGMSELGPLTFGAKEEEIFLGREIVQHRDYSEETAVAIDGAVRSIVMRCMERAETILKQHRDTLDNIALALLDREILDSEDIAKLVKGEELPPLQRPASDGVIRKDGEAEQLRLDLERAEKIRKAVEELKRQDEQGKQYPVADKDAESPEGEGEEARRDV
jgi:cell division protease FtsH